MAEAYPEWKRLNDILAIIKTEGFDRLRADEIVEFGKLYRRATSELAYHQTHEAHPARSAYLNQLVGQCYPYVYVAPRRPWPSFITFFTTEFPRTLRRYCGWVFLAFLLTMLPAAIGYGITWHDHAIADQVLPDVGGDYIVERHHTARDWLPMLKRAPSAGLIIGNNIRVAILAFAGGMTFGILTIISLIQNGLMLGIIAAAVGRDGPATATNFWGFVAPHGVIELTAIFIAGGAGLLIAYALINPGEFPRRYAVRYAAEKALILVLGVAAMLVIAGFVEGFFSPQTIPEIYKFSIAAGEGVLLFSYFLFAGKKGDHASLSHRRTMPR